MSATCPVCQAPQDAGLMCHACVCIIEKDLAEVRALMGELDTTASRQDRAPIAAGGGPRPTDSTDDDAGLGSLAHTRTPVGWRAVHAADDLANCLTSWARDVTNERIAWGLSNPTAKAARILLNNIPAIRRHAAAKELFDGVTEAIHDAWRAVDRAADKQYFGQCLASFDNEGTCECDCHGHGAYPPPCSNPGGCGPHAGATCVEEIWASRSASSATCKVCGVTHDVAERRAWLLERAADMIVTVKEASSYLGEVGGIKVSQSSIRGYLHRGRLAYRPGVTNGIRLGDLLQVVLDESERKLA